MDSCPCSGQGINLSQELRPGLPPPDETPDKGGWGGWGMAEKK